MEEQDPKGFKIDFTEDETEPRAKKTAVPPKKKPSSAPGLKAGIISLLLFGLLAGLLFFGYFILDDRIRQIEAQQDRQSRQVEENIEEVAAKRFSALSDLVSEPTRQLKARVLELEKQVKNLSSANSELEKTLAEFRRESKNRIAGVEKQVSAQKKSSQSGISDLESRLTAELEKLRETTTALEQTLGEAGKFGPRINEAEKRIAAFSDRFANLEEKINAVQKQARTGADTAELEKQLTDLKNTLNRKINDNRAGLRKQIQDLQQQIQSLEAIIRTLERVQTSGENTGSGAGEMIEQELQ
ncbi:MAG: hypothetical protein R6U41_12595 [Desulfosalsimonas sp.]|uniref:hypothetical protein n=1 Tax=Desulfosalsimonas sp. TaxID=3073848 RepID=UPI003971062C